MPKLGSSFAPSLQELKYNPSLDARLALFKEIGFTDQEGLVVCRMLESFGLPSQAAARSFANEIDVNFETMQQIERIALSRLAHRCWEELGSIFLNGKDVTNLAFPQLSTQLQWKIQQIETQNSSISQADQVLLGNLAYFVQDRRVIEAFHAEWAAATREHRKQVSDRQSFVREVSLTQFKGFLPQEIRSIRLAGLSASSLGVYERHLNSDQYLYSFEGRGATHVKRGSDIYVDRYGGRGDAIEDRWHVVPAQTWHKSVPRGIHCWIVVAFHTAEDVIDEY